MTPTRRPTSTPENFLEAYDEQVSRVFSYLAYRLPSRADAEDLTQVTFERAFRAWHQFDPAKASVGTWLISIAHNALVDHRRRHHADPQLSTEELADRSMPSYEQDMTPGVNEELDVALRTLNQRERQVIALHFGGDLSGPQIADILELKPDNVYQILSRTLRKLRDLLEVDR